MKAQMGVDDKGEFRWRNSRSLAGVQSVLQGAINGCTNGATVEVDIKTAHNLIEIIRQAKKTETGHGN